ncbi:hypothetical protein EV363DRAFT_1417036 [Boletus edulis]|nr:hypothetical protein EV363DRAFT_1417036 [Boletus edulis]
MHGDPSRGFPLYAPEPDRRMPPDYQARGARIGNLGYIVWMGGSAAFSICVYPQITRSIVSMAFPELSTYEFGEERDHEDVQVRPNEDLPGGVVSTCPTRVIQLNGTADARDCTSTVGAGFSVQFTSSKAEGAMLVLPHGTEKRDLLTTRKLERVARENARSWYSFACANLGRHVNNNSLFIVTGHHKASSWCLASFSQAAGTTELSLSLQAGPVIRASVGAGCNWDTRDSASVRAGPGDEFDETCCNQAIFLRGLTITHRRGLAVGNTAHTSEGQATDSDPDVSSPLHPAVLINNYLLDKFPDADVAITHDDQWMGVSVECGGPEDKLIERVCERFVPVYDAINAAAYSESTAESNIGYCNHDKQHVSHLEHVGGDHEQLRVNKQRPSHKCIICTVVS